MAGQVWSVAADGGNLYSDELSRFFRRVLLPTVRYRQFCDADDFTDKGLHRGQSFYWDIIGELETRGGRLDENQKMPESKMAITQGNGQVYEYGNSVPYTGLLNDLSKAPLKRIIAKGVKTDAARALDDAAYAEFDATPLVVCPVSGTSTTAVTLETDGAHSVANAVAMSFDHVKVISDIMKERNIPGYFPNGDYGCIGRPATFRGVKDDLEDLHKYVDAGFDMILEGEAGRAEGVRFFEQTNVASAGWASAKSDKAFFFGEDTVHEAIVILEEIRGKIGADYGRDRGCAWYALLGFKIVHSTAAQARIVEWSSLN